MKLRKLIIHNIASIEDAEIDFEAEPLSSSEVFLITGKTGAGKSTILDAICLALYADTPRLDNTLMQGETTEGETVMRISDPRQLMRINTGEAYVVLTFLGSNGRSYEATWSVARSRNKIGGKLQSKKWQLHDLDGDFTLTREAEIKAEIRQAIGLDFSQFCRTTMLAQGEFTRFLNSKDEEKASILEKITGVDIYSRIGKKVYELTDEKQSIWKEAQQKLSGLQLLSEEDVAAKRQQMQAIDSDLATTKANHDKEKTKFDWMEEAQALTEKMQSVSRLYTEALSKTEAEEYKADEQLIAAWNVSMDARSILKDIQREAQEADRQTRTIDRLTGQFEELTSGVKWEQERLAERDLPALLAKKEQMQTQLTNLNTARERLLALATERTRRQKASDNLASLLAAINSLKEEASRQEPIAHDAKIIMDERQKALQLQKHTVNEWASSIRARLHIGDRCPVCMQLIEADVPHEEELSRLYEAANSAFVESEKLYRKEERKLQMLTASITAKGQEYDKAKKAFDEDHSLEQAETSAQKALISCGMEEFNLSHSLLGRAVERPFLDEIALQQKQVENSKNQLEAVTNTLLKIDKLRSNLQSAKNQLLAAKKNKAEAEAKLAAWLDEHEDMNCDYLQQLSAYTPEQIHQLSLQHKRLQDAVLQHKTLLDEVRRQQTALQERKPELHEEDTLESLTIALKQADETIANLNIRKGTIHEELRRDEENKRQQQLLLKDAEEKCDIYQRWSRLNQLVGDATGNKFRKIAQSYVLSSLIRAANSYMRTLTDRYTLIVTPGTFVISIEDAWQGYTRRACSTISGGESFLVSLSLALALSDIGHRLSVDTIFIDEGFGTLSGEPLQNAVNTLRTLHTKSGRHVGIISHIEELQERIPVQIQVRQEGNSSSSRISITTE